MTTLTSLTSSVKSLYALANNASYSYSKNTSSSSTAKNTNTYSSMEEIVDYYEKDAEEKIAKVLEKYNSLSTEEDEDTETEKGNTTYQEALKKLSTSSVTTNNTKKSTTLTKSDYERAGMGDYYNAQQLLEYARSISSYNNLSNNNFTISV